MDRTIGKSENRNNDGERLMKILDSYKEMMYQFINEADDNEGEGRIDMSDPVMQKKGWYKDNPELTVGGVLKQGEKHPAYDDAKKEVEKAKGKDSGADDAGKLSGKSDFSRDGGDEPDPIGDKGDVPVGELPDRSSELPKKTAKQQSDFEKKRDAMFKKARGGAEDDVKADLRKNPEKLDDMSAEELEDVFPSHEEYMEFETLRNQKVLKDRHPKLHKLASQSIQAKQELESLEKELKDKLGSGEFADPFVKGKEDPEGKKKFEDHQQKIKDAEEKMEDASLEVYYYQQDNANALDGDDIPYDVEDLVRGEENKKDESIKVINGKTYKPIKEGKKKSNPRILKEIYDRTFRSLK